MKEIRMPHVLVDFIKKLTKHEAEMVWDYLNAKPVSSVEEMKIALQTRFGE